MRFNAVDGSTQIVNGEYFKGFLFRRKLRMELEKMKRDEVVHEIEEDLEVVQTIEKGDGQVI